MSFWADGAPSSSAARSAAPKDVFDEIVANIAVLSKDHAELNRMVSELGSRKDNAAHRAALAAKRDKTLKLSTETKALLQFPAVRADHFKHDKLSTQFNTCLAQLEQTWKTSSQKEREIVTQLRASISVDTPVPEEPLGPNVLQLGEVQLTEITSYDVQNALITERNKEIAEINRGLEILAEMMIDTNLEVVRQGETLNVVEQQVETTSENVISGNKQLAQAASYANGIRWKYIGICCFAVVIILIIALLAVKFTCGLPCR